VYRFGAFELDSRSGELRKHGVRIKLQEQPLQVLLLLLQHPGLLVTREQIQERLWAKDTYVDYDNAINRAIRKLRDALGDTSENPRFIETLARRGYRFLGNIEGQPSQAERVGSPAITDRAPIDDAAVSSRSRKFKTIAAVGAVSLALAFLAAWATLRREEGANQLVSVPLTAAEGSEFDVTFSPDGNQVAYAWDENGSGARSHIYVKMFGAGRPVRLTASPHADYAPTWSPNGSQIAFIRDTGQVKAIYLIEPVGGTEHKVAEGQFRGSMSWSRDSKYLAVADINLATDNNPSLYLVSTQNGHKLRLTTQPDQKTWDQDPAFAPSGRRFLFTRRDGLFYCGLYLLDLTLEYQPSREPMLLRRETRSIGGSAWTQDGREVVYAVSDDGGLNHHLMRIRLGRTDSPQRLTYAGERSSYPAIAPRGNRLAYTQDLGDFDIWQVQAGKLPQSFLASRRLEYNPEYSPDGKHIAFSSNRSGMMEIWVCDQDGGNQVQLTRFERHSGSPRGLQTAVGLHLIDISMRGGGYL
jgi:Tol biopolymer transport system component